jgi:hypothetical protein
MTQETTISHKHVADFIPVHAARIIPTEDAERMPSEQLKVELDLAVRGLRVDMEAYIAAMPGEWIRLHRQWPADWWQAFRERWAPRWWLARHPVRYEELHVDEQKYGPICPHLPSDDRSLHLEWLTKDQTEPSDPADRVTLYRIPEGHMDAYGEEIPEGIHGTEAGAPKDASEIAIHRVVGADFPEVYFVNRVWLEQFATEYVPAPATGKE